MNTEFWGPSAWKFLHTIVAIYPIKGLTLTDKLMMRDFMQILCDILPCKYCRASFTQYSNSLEITPYLESNILIQEWLYKMHNKVNSKLRRQGLCTKENPSFEHIVNIYNMKVKNILDILNKDSKNSKCMTIINYICNLGIDFLGSIIFNYQGYSANCHTNEEKTKITSTYHKFFNMIQPMICKYITKLNPQADSYQIIKLKIRHILLQNEPYSKLKQWFYQCDFICLDKQFKTLEEYENHFNKHIVSFCNNPKIEIKSCRKLTKKRNIEHIHNKK